MLLVIALSALGVVTVGSVFAYQRGAATRLREQGRLGRDKLMKALPPPKVEPERLIDRTLDKLEVGDVILHGDRDWLIVGTLSYVEENERWWLHHVEDASEHLWLEVRERDGWSAAFLQPARDIPDFGQLYDGLTHRGLPFRLWRRGDARLSVDGDVAGREPGMVSYACYEGPGEGVLSIEEVGKKRISLTGDRVIGEGLDLMPGQRPEAL